MNISASRAICLFPFAYFATSRAWTSREMTYLVATSWLPAIWLLWRLTDLSVAGSALAFAAGYLAYISIYEIGYLVNDAWDAPRSPQGRQRLNFPITPSFALAFVAIRLAVWAVVGVLTGWIDNPLWLAGYAALCLAIAQHNIFQSNGLRLASFYELATLRFLLPVLAALPAASLPAAILTALLLYSFPRFLGYLDSKDILNLPERREPQFGFFLILSLAPLLLFSAYLLRTTALVELTAYYLVIYGIWWAMARLPQAPR
ncbi:hypothetical protein LZ496_00970 [Sphingomonas sp. NSE70-1]|uniref:4-hydroxybenzoate polyprenyltransferase n=1 Tax=Sphingomonas caseinilyticus TaxID=2908205 RepID=A0ABT0RR19_9SPHN|nr:hypothetical protein [Sphingomonas caseinilyticus]MCL6697364.1 hypothetical protein [Sphingomonas caseinilyticus]